MNTDARTSPGSTILPGTSVQITPYITSVDVPERRTKLCSACDYRNAYSDDQTIQRGLGRLSIYPLGCVSYHTQSLKS